MDEELIKALKKIQETCEKNREDIIKINCRECPLGDGNGECRVNGEGNEVVYPYQWKINDTGKQTYRHLF